MEAWETSIPGFDSMGMDVSHDETAKGKTISHTKAQKREAQVQGHQTCFQTQKK
jgi:hypothetical protein